MAWKPAASSAVAIAARPWLPLTMSGVDIVVAEVDGVWYGVEDRCTHAGCSFSEDGALHGTDIVCNCHGSEFDIKSGAVLRGPAERPVRTFAVRVVGDGVEVDL